jgi:hypothetical protein
MNIGTGIQAGRRFRLRNLRGCNIGITEGGFMNYAVEMGLDVMICIPHFIKIGLGNQTLIVGYIYRQTTR